MKPLTLSVIILIIAAIILITVFFLAMSNTIMLSEALYVIPIMLVIIFISGITFIQELNN